jgi:DNA-binding NtrC family response regulator
MSQPLIHIVSADKHLPGDVLQYLTRHGFKVIQSGRQTEAFRLFQQCRPDLTVIFASEADNEADLETVRLLRQQSRTTPLVLIVRDSSERKAIAALRAGVTDYFRGPVASRDLLESIQRHLPAPQPDPSPGVPASQDLTTEPAFVGVSPAILKLKDYLIRAAAMDCNVLITGETGTGKEKVAELVHWHSARRPRPMVCINCAALPENLLESELFGYERGAFTGALSSYPGKLLLAEGGTVFLDEIFEMSPYMQAKILRALDTRKIHRLGGKKAIPVDFRIVAATNQEPERAMEQGSLRRDLYYRLNVARVHLPPPAAAPD